MIAMSRQYCHRDRFEEEKKLDEMRVRSGTRTMQTGITAGFACRPRAPHCQYDIHVELMGGDNSIICRRKGFRRVCIHTSWSGMVGLRKVGWFTGCQQIYSDREMDGRLGDGREVRSDAVWGR